MARGEGGLAPAAIVAADKADYAFLSLKSPAFDLSDRGVAGRQVPTGLDAFVYTERGVYRSGETVHVTSLLRDARGIAAAAPLTLVMERPDGVEYRRALLRRSGPRRPQLERADRAHPPRPAPGACRLYRSQASAGRRGQLPGRGLCAPTASNSISTSAAKVIPRDAPAQLSVDGHFLYGAPASNLDLQGTVTIAAAKERPGFAGYSFGLADDEVTPCARTSTICRRPTRPARRVSR